MHLVLFSAALSNFVIYIQPIADIHNVLADSLSHEQFARSQKLALDNASQSNSHQCTKGLVVKLH